MLKYISLGKFSTVLSYDNNLSFFSRGYFLFIICYLTVFDNCRVGQKIRVWCQEELRMRCMHDDGRWRRVCVYRPGMDWTVSDWLLRQSSWLLVLPSSHCSPRSASTTPSPHRLTWTPHVTHTHTADSKQHTGGPKSEGHFLMARVFNPLMGTGNYSATSNNMKLVHWPLMGGLLHLVQQGGDWAGLQPAYAGLSSLYQM